MPEAGRLLRLFGSGGSGGERQGVSIMRSAHTARFSALKAAVAVFFACLLGVGSSLLAFAAGDSVREYDATVDMPASDANSWQVVEQDYASVKAGAGTYAYSDGDEVRLQKAVMADDSENRFQVYLNVEPQLSWEEFFKSLDNYQTHNNSSTFNPSSGCARLLSQDEYDVLPASQQAWYEKMNVRYNMGDGTYYDVVRYGNFHGEGKDKIQNVKNGSYAWSSQKFNTNGLLRGVDWPSVVAAAQGGGDIKLEVDASGLKKQYAFASGVVYPKSVSDPMGCNIVFDGVVSADEGAVSAPAAGSKDGTIEWSLPTTTPPNLPYYGTHTEAGTIPGTGYETDVTILENVVVADRGGKQTAYYTGVLEMRYRISLDVLGEGFVSCGNPAVGSSGQAIVSTNGVTELSYQVSGVSKAAEFPLPKVRGLLYSLEVGKADEENSSAMLAGAVFALLDADGSPMLDASGAAVTAVTGSDGVAKFRGLSAGTYSVKEVSPPPGYSITDSSTHGSYELCWTTNSRNLVSDHAGQHECDLPSDAAAMTLAGSLDVFLDRHVLGLEVLKRDGDSEAPLQGVGFALKIDDGNGVYDDADALADVWSDAQLSNPSGEGYTNADGKIAFYGLESGTYWIEETWTLAGYQGMAEPVKMVVTPDRRVLFHQSGVEVAPDDDYVVRIVVDNFKLPALPSAGSRGHPMLTLAGLAMLVLSLALACRGRCSAVDGSGLRDRKTRVW